VSKWLANLGAGLPTRRRRLSGKSSRRAAGHRSGAARAARAAHSPDCHPGNILVMARGSLASSTLTTVHRPPLFDLASYAVHHLKWQTDNAAGTRLWLANLPALVQGYRTQRRLPQSGSRGAAGCHDGVSPPALRLVPEPARLDSIA